MSENDGRDQALSVVQMFLVILLGRAVSKKFVFGGLQVHRLGVSSSSLAYSVLALRNHRISAYPSHTGGTLALSRHISSVEF